MSSYPVIKGTRYRVLHNQMQGYISSNMRKIEHEAKKPPKVAPWKDHPVTKEFEELAKNILKGELKRRGITYAQLVERLAKIGIQETERNLNNKISRGGFTAAFMLQCMMSIGANELRIV